MIRLSEPDHIYYDDTRKVDGVSEILRATGISSPPPCTSEQLLAGQQLGKAFHLMTVLQDEGQLDVASLSLGLIPYYESYLTMLKLYPTKKIILKETPLHSKKWDFAGTPDRVWELGKKFILIDFKTTSSIGKDELRAIQAQVAGYQILVEENLGIKISERWCMHFNPRFKVIQLPNNEYHKSVFLSANTLYKFLK